MQHEAALSTLARSPAGHPFGSLVHYALDERGRPLLLLSRLAEHTQNLLADPRAALLVIEPREPRTAGAAEPDALALGRVTLLGRLAAVADGEADAARARYLARHPSAERYLAMKDFAFYRMEVEALRYVGGFGRMSWVSADDYLRAG
jgi:putative heme iron utilization protein